MDVELSVLLHQPVVVSGSSQRFNPFFGMQHGIWPPIEPPVAIYYPHRVTSLDPARLKPWDRCSRIIAVALMLSEHQGWL